MGLDATVRCRCFEEGKLKPVPVPFDDLHAEVYKKQKEFIKHLLMVVCIAACQRVCFCVKTNYGIWTF